MLHGASGQGRIDNPNYNRSVWRRQADDTACAARDASPAPGTPRPALATARHRLGKPGSHKPRKITTHIPAIFYCRPRPT